MSPKPVDWPTWHCAYGDPRSPLAYRLAAVRELVGDELDRRPPPLTIISNLRWRR